MDHRPALRRPLRRRARSARPQRGLRLRRPAPARPRRRDGRPRRRRRAPARWSSASSRRSTGRATAATTPSSCSRRQPATRPTPGPARGDGGRRRAGGHGHHRRSAMLRTGNKLALAHIGDSRGYLLRDGTLTQITKDHSFVQNLVDEGRITPEEAEHHPQRSLVIRVLTGHEDDEPDLSDARGPARRPLPALLRRPVRASCAGDTIEEVMTEGARHGRDRRAADRARPARRRPRQRHRHRRRRRRPRRSGDAPSTAPEVVGAAAERRRTGPTRAMPVSPAEKAAALSRRSPRRRRRRGDERRAGRERPVLAAAALGCAVPACVAPGPGRARRRRLRGVRLDPAAVLRRRGRRPASRSTRASPRTSGRGGCPTSATRPTCCWRTCPTDFRDRVNATMSQSSPQPRPARWSPTCGRRPWPARRRRPAAVACGSAITHPARSTSPSSTATLADATPLADAPAPPPHPPEGSRDAARAPPRPHDDHHLVPSPHPPQRRAAAPAVRRRHRRCVAYAQRRAWRCTAAFPPDMLS